MTTVCMVMCARNESQAIIDRAITSARSLCDEIHFVDTTNIDSNFGQNITNALRDAKDKAKWLLVLHADQTISHCHDLKEWLDSDPDPTVDIWNVQMQEGGMTWRLPLLTRGGIEWNYEGPLHEWLNTQNRPARDLLGLSIIHHADGVSHSGDQMAKFLNYVERLRPDYDRDDPRATFYTAESYRFAGKAFHLHAIADYQKRAKMGGFEEEAWYAQYQAARLSGSIDSLMAAFARRPWRHEPLTEIARIIAATPNSDVLFKEPI